MSDVVLCGWIAAERHAQGYKTCLTHNIADVASRGVVGAAGQLLNPEKIRKTLLL